MIFYILNLIFKYYFFRLKFFLDTGSKSSQCSTSKAQIISPALSSLSTSLSHYQQLQKEITNINNGKNNSNGLKLVHVHTLTKENIVVAVEVIFITS